MLIFALQMNIKQNKLKPLDYVRGISNHPLYSIYAGMVSRCHDTSYYSYRFYGKRGIRVCDRWLKSFNDFTKDVGERPSKKYSLDRINNDGNYEPSNCRWATRQQQYKNKRKRMTDAFYLKLKRKRRVVIKQLTSNDVWEIFKKKRNKVEILLDAIDLMQQYNGRSKVTCVAMAMGYETEDGIFTKKNIPNHTTK